MSNAKVVWITGASAGIGRALAIEMAGRGYSVAATARSESKLKELENSKIKPGKIKAFPGDVLEGDALVKLAETIENDLGKIDLVVANAGTHKPTKGAEFDATEYKNLMDLNFGGTMNTLQAVVPKMVSRRSGHVAVVSSLVGYRGVPRAAAYGATKAALINFCESLRFDLLSTGVDVSVINPGFVKTPLTDKNDFEMPFLIEAEEAARSIANGLEKRSKEIAFPRTFAWICKCTRVIPFPLYSWLIKKTILKNEQR